MEKLRELLEKHLNKEIEFRGENIGIKFCRKFYPYYVNGFQGASRLRGELVLMNDLKEIFKNFTKLMKETPCTISVQGGFFYVAE